MLFKGVLHLDVQSGRWSLKNAVPCTLVQCYTLRLHPDPQDRDPFFSGANCYTITYANLQRSHNVTLDGRSLSAECRTTDTGMREASPVY